MCVCEHCQQPIIYSLRAKGCRANQIRRPASWSGSSGRVIDEVLTLILRLALDRQELYFLTRKAVSDNRYRRVDTQDPQSAGARAVTASRDGCVRVTTVFAVALVLVAVLTIVPSAPMLAAVGLSLAATGLFVTPGPWSATSSWSGRPAQAHYAEASAWLSTGLAVE
jgi:hypothetical protein